MNARKVEIRFEGPNAKPWRLYWSCTDDLATEDRFATLEEAGKAAWQLIEELEDDDAEAELAAQ